MSRKVLPGIMDPAMTAANAIHNTCLVLLHERIAYPDPSLHWMRLPSIDSAEICIRAATEVCTILTRFIAQRKEPHAFSPQLGLCAFVSARNLLSKILSSQSGEEFELMETSPLAKVSFDSC